MKGKIGGKKQTEIDMEKEVCVCVSRNIGRVSGFKGLTEEKWNICAVSYILRERISTKGKQSEEDNRPEKYICR